MELTTSYQMIGETYVGSSYGDLYIRIYAKYNSQSISDNTSNVSYQSRAYFTGSWITSQGQTKVEMQGTGFSNITTYWQNFEQRQDGTFGNGETVLKTVTTTINHNVDGTASISASAIYSSAGSWGWSGTASGIATLPSLHKPPEILTAQMEETNQDLIDLGLPNTTIVQYLSQKTITLRATTSDDATPYYRLEHFNTDYTIPAQANTYQASNVFNTDYTQNDVVINSSGKAKIIQRIKDSMNGMNSDWLFVTINGQITEPNGIAYTKPSIERTSTTIKRKSGNGTNLTDNKAELNLKASFYKENNIVGNNNSITAIGYKIWATDDTEPVNYTSITPTISGGEITVTNLEISNVNFIKVYNYKIIITDYYGYSAIVDDGIVPLGQPTWTEYKDRVDFLKLTVGGYNPFEYNENEEIIVGVYDDGNDKVPIYRKVFAGTSTINDGVSIDIASLGVDFILNAYGWIHSTYGQWWPINNHYPPDTNYDTSTVYTSASFAVHCESYFSYPDYRIILEYTKQ